MASESVNSALPTASSGVAPSTAPSTAPSIAHSAAPSLSPLKLTEWTACGGCAAKWGANLLKDLVDDLAAGATPTIDPALLVGLAPFDDAAVYQVSDDGAS